jgi:hypothetical protein
MRLLVDLRVEELLAEVEGESESAEDFDVEEVAVGEEGVHEGCLGVGSEGQRWEWVEGGEKGGKV